MFVATDTGASEIDGRTINFTKDKTRVREGDPLLKVAGQYFEPVDGGLDEETADAPTSKTGR